MGIFNFCKSEAEKNESPETLTCVWTIEGQNFGHAHLKGGQTFEYRLPHNVRHLGNVFYKCLGFQRKYLATCADLSA